MNSVSVLKIKTVDPQAVDPKSHKQDYVKPKSGPISLLSVLEAENFRLRQAVPKHPTCLHRFQAEVKARSERCDNPRSDRGGERVVAVRRRSPRNSGSQTPERLCRLPRSDERTAPDTFLSRRQIHVPWRRLAHGPLIGLGPAEKARQRRTFRRS